MKEVQVEIAPANNYIALQGNDRNRPDRPTNCAIWNRITAFRPDYKQLFAGIIFART